MSENNAPLLKNSDVFISYGRKESKHFANKLYNKLKSEGFEVWFDQNDIPLAVDFQAQIDEGILKTNNFIFIISPHSIKSEYCSKEISLAIAYNKRIIPILHVEPQSKEIWDLLHPQISKLNWIYFREQFNSKNESTELETIDDFETASGNLLKLLKYQTNYVAQHTEFLIKAIEWIRNFKRPELLLKNEQYAKAEKWLQIKFENEQPPCLPTLLHYEYIAESKELENNYQTDIFISYENQNIDFAKKIHTDLIKNTYTTWFEETDLVAGENYESQIFTGIEKASYFMYLISANSIENTNCINQLNHALKHNKPIIPVKIENIDSNLLPEQIKKLFLISIHKSEAEYVLEFPKVLFVVNKNYPEITLHKQILVKALEWEKNKYELKYLLRGFELELATEWLNNTNLRKEYSPTSLQQKYITQSLQSQQTIFISYARNPSKQFATLLYDKLKEKNYDVWFDQKNIPLAVDFQEQIDKGIEKSDNFLFIITPNSSKSVYCAKEIELAVKYNKRIIPVLHVESNENENNLHPAVSKINWIFARENQDNFNNAFTGIVQVIESSSDYIAEHTLYLRKALEWDRNQRKANFLLRASERLEAENWLKTYEQYKDTGALPTSIHSSFITESKKDAFDFYSDVYISYAEDDAEIKNMIKKHLNNKGFVVTDNTDFKPGNDFTKSIHDLIEKADNIVFIVSEKSVKTEYCIEELSHALIFNKRILPAYISNVEYSELLPELQDIKPINLHFTDNKIADSNQIIQIINTDNEYFYNHKKLLIKALSWKKQKSNNCLLLNGYELEQANSWFNLAKNKNNFAPTFLHQNYITESNRNAPLHIPEIYLLYNEIDYDFAVKINNALQTAAKSTWFDKSFIPSTENITEHLQNGILASENIIILLSGNLIKSPTFDKELTFAKNINKRIIIVKFENIAQPDFPTVLTNFESIDFTNYVTDFHTPFSELYRELDTNKSEIKDHNKWLNKATDWQTSNNSKDLLLRGIELEQAKNWLTKVSDPKSKLKPTQLQTNFISTSAKLALNEQKKSEKLKRLKRIASFIVAALFVVSVIFAFVILQQYKTTNTLLTSAKIDKLLLIADEQLKTNPTLAFQIVQEAHKINPSTPVQLKAQDFYLKGNFYKTIFSGLNAYHAVEISPDEKHIAAIYQDEIHIFNTDGLLIRQITGHNAIINSLHYNKTGKYLITSSDDQTICLWDTSGVLLKTLNDHTNSVNDACISADDKIIISGGSDNSIVINNLQNNTKKIINQHQHPVWSVAISPDGKYFISASFDRTAKLWTIDGKLLKTYTVNDIIVDVDFSFDGQYFLINSRDNNLYINGVQTNYEKIVSFTDPTIIKARFAPAHPVIIATFTDKTIHIMDLAGTRLSELKGHHKNIISVSMAKSGTFLVSSSDDFTLRKWYINGLLTYVKTFENKNMEVVSLDEKKGTLFYNLAQNLYLADTNGNILQTYTVHTNLISDLAISPDGNTLITSARDNSVIKWDKNGTLLSKYTYHDDIVNALDISSDGKYFISASDDMLIIIYNSKTNTVKKIEGSTSFYDVKFLNNNEQFITANGNKIASLWDTSGNVLRMFVGHQAVVSKIDISPDGKYVLTASKDKTLKLWDLYGNLLVNFEGHTDDINDIDFSPDGAYIASCSKDKTIRLWNNTGQCIHIYNSGADQITDVDFSQNGKKLITVSMQGTLRIFDTKVPLNSFLSQNQIENLDPFHLLEYLIIDFNQAKKLNTIPELINAAFYYETYVINLQNIDEKIEYQLHAVELYQKALSLSNQFTENNNKAAIAMINLAYFYLKTKKFTKALKFAEMAFSTDKNEKSVYSTLALAYILTDNFEAAAKIYTKFKSDNFNQIISFKELFLGDLIAIEAENITHPDFEKAFKLLGKYSDK